MLEVKRAVSKNSCSFFRSPRFHRSYATSNVRTRFSYHSQPSPELTFAIILPRLSQVLGTLRTELIGGFQPSNFPGLYDTAQRLLFALSFLAFRKYHLAFIRGRRRRFHVLIMTAQPMLVWWPGTRCPVLSQFPGIAWVPFGALCDGTDEPKSELLFSGAPCRPSHPGPAPSTNRLSAPLEAALSRVEQQLTEPCPDSSSLHAPSPSRPHLTVSLQSVSFGPAVHASRCWFFVSVSRREPCRQSLLSPSFIRLSEFFFVRLLERIRSTVQSFASFRFLVCDSEH